MAAWKCEKCRTAWPAESFEDKTFRDCPGCERKCHYEAQTFPTADDGGVNRALFERYYAERGEREVAMDWTWLERALDDFRALEAIPVLPESGV
jgi:hypothetical protein